MYHRFSDPQSVGLSVTRSTAGQTHTELTLVNGKFEFNRGEPDSFTITGNVGFTLDNAGSFSAILIIEPNAGALIANLRIYPDKSDAQFFLPILQNFNPKQDGYPYIEFWSQSEFNNLENPYTAIDKIELNFSKFIG